MSDTSTHTEGSSGSGKGPKNPKKKKDRPGPFRRTSLFLREVVAELRKVVWPTRKELATYTTTVVVFVLIMAVLVALLDFVFTKGVLLVFGSD